MGEKKTKKSEKKKTKKSEKSRKILWFPSIAQWLNDQTPQKDLGLGLTISIYLTLTSQKGILVPR